MNVRKDRETLRWIFRVCGSALWWTVLLILIRIIYGCAVISYGYRLGSVVDSAQSGIRDAFFQELMGFIFLALFTVFMQALARYVLEKSKAVLDKRLRLHVFSQLLCRDYAQVTRIHSGEWMNRITSDTAVVVNATAVIVPDLAGAMVRMVGAAAALMQIVPQVVYIILPGGVLIMVLSYFVRRHLKRYHKEAQQADGKARSFMQERFSSLLVVRTFMQEKSTERMAAENMDEFVAARMRRFNYTNISSTSFSLAINGAQILGIGLCGWGILNGTMSYGTMSSVLYMINLLESPFANISGHFAQYFSMLASAERLMEIEEYKLDMAQESMSVEAVQQYYNENLESLGLDHACFSYEEGKENVVLKNLSLSIRRGEFVAFTGESGCGKSTALKVLLSLYPLNAGNSYLQNRDGSRHLLDASWRGLFAYVPQGNQLISGTIRETLAFMDADLMAQEDKIWEALQIACADTFVKEQPHGLDTVLGERGSGLSEGQMQRLSIARAILSQRPILLLDEATSALDLVTEQQLLENLHSMTDRTVVIITHREAVLKYCDKQIHFEKIETEEDEVNHG